MGHKMDGLAMKKYEYFKHISNERRHVLIYLFIYLKRILEIFSMLMNEQVLIFYFGSMKVMINSGEDNLCKGQNPLEASVTVLYNESRHFIFALVWRSNKGVCHTMALPFTIKKYLKAKEEELWKLKYFTMQKYNLQNNPLKRNQNP
jgi:hypothetical protein